MSWPFIYPYPSESHQIAPLNQLFATAHLEGFNQKSLINILHPSLFNITSNSHLFSSQKPENNVHIYPNFPTFPRIFNREPSIEEKQNEAKILQQRNQSRKYKQEIQDSESNSADHIGLHRKEILKKPKSLISHNCSLRNDTKNIPKNYGKAMLSYILKNTRQVKEILSKFEVDYLKFMIFVKSFKSKINTIHDLREMWGENEKQNKIMKCIRILSYHFMRKKCLPYIFNSRVKNYHTHIKYRNKIMEGIRNPQNFTKIKQF